MAAILNFVASGVVVDPRMCAHVRAIYKKATDVRVKLGAIRALGAIGTDASMAVLIGEAATIGSSIELRAQRLAQERTNKYSRDNDRSGAEPLTSVQFSTYMRESLQNIIDDDPRTAVLAEVMTALGRVNSSSARIRDMLAYGLRFKNWHVRKAAIFALADKNDYTALKTLRDQLRREEQLTGITLSSRIRIIKSAIARHISQMRAGEERIIRRMNGRLFLANRSKTPALLREQARAIAFMTNVRYAGACAREMLTAIIRSDSKHVSVRALAVRFLQKKFPAYYASLSLSRPNMVAVFSQLQRVRVPTGSLPASISSSVFARGATSP